MSRQRMTVFYSGRVQGVGFRYTVKSITTGFEVTGTVRNLADGRVELIAEGEDDELAAFRGAIRDSGLGGLIQREEETFAPALGQFRGFEIVR
jgi:acylphosphatase